MPRAGLDKRRQNPKERKNQRRSEQYIEVIRMQHRRLTENRRIQEIRSDKSHEGQDDNLRRTTANVCRERHDHCDKSRNKQSFPSKEVPRIAHMPRAHDIAPERDVEMIAIKH